MQIDDSPGGRIVVGVAIDSAGTEQSRAALSWAVRHAAYTGFEVTAITAWHAPVHTIPLGARPRELDRQRAQTVLRGVTGSVPGTDVVEVEVLLHEGPAGEVLVGHARGADVLVLGHRLGRVTAAGPVAQHCLRHASCPVVLVPDV